MPTATALANLAICRHSGHGVGQLSIKWGNSLLSPFWGHRGRRPAERRDFTWLWARCLCNPGLLPQLLPCRRGRLRTAGTSRIGRRCRQSMGMLDGTKMLLGPRGDFRNQGEQSVGVGAIDTSDLLDAIQIGQQPPIEDQVVFSGNFGNSVDGKTDELVESNRSIQQQKGEHAKVNERR